MTLPIIPTGAACFLLAALIYKYLIYPAFVSPLAKIPNAHWSSPLSPLWILYHRQQQNDTPTVHAAHVRSGPIIRLAPNEISVNSVDGGIRTIYAGGYEKKDWYLNAFANYGVPPMFAMEERDMHSKRKRMLSNTYAKSSLQTNPALGRTTEILINERLIPILERGRRANRPVEIYDVFSSATMDFVTAYIFGLKNGSDFIRQPDEAIKLFRDFKARQIYTFWPQELPNLTELAFRLGLGWLLIPDWVSDSNDSLEAWLMSMCDKAESTLSSPAPSPLPPEDHPTVYAQLRNALLSSSSSSSSSTSSPPDLSPHRLDLASELLDHTFAGYDTSGITLTFLAWELSLPHNRRWQLRLRDELRPLDGSLDAKLLDSRPVLHAVLMETLRLHAAIPGNQPRVTPEDAALGDPRLGLRVAGLPAGVRVQAQAWSLHRNPDVFPEPERWEPGRWLGEGAGDVEGRKREMARWFWAFGSGGRMCVGSNFAMLDMKAIVAGIWGTFGTEIVEDRGMVHNGGYLAEPKGWGPEEGKGVGKKFLVLRLTGLGEL